MSEREYRSLVDRAREDASVLGLILTGSRGRGIFVRLESDWDVRLVVRDDAREEYASGFGRPRGAPIEVVVFSLSGFERAGAVGTANEWDRYSYAHAQVVLDKLDGRIAELVAEKSVLPEEAARQIGADALDTYINSYYRSAKNLRAGLPLEAHLDAAESIAPFLTALFALHERVRPFNKFLRWELENFPLGSERWKAPALLPRLEAITATGAIGEQQALFRDAEELARERGLSEVVDGWEPDVGLLHGR